MKLITSAIALTSAGLGLLCAMALTVGCPPSPVAPPPDADAVAPTPGVDATPAPSSPEQAACSAMSIIGCQEGKMDDCASSLHKVNADPHFVHADLAKLAAAKTPADVRAAGTSCTMVSP